MSSGLSSDQGEPQWLADLQAATDAHVAAILRGDPPPCGHESCRDSGMAMCMGVMGARMDMTRAEDRERPDRICFWCFHPRNSDECQFAAKHDPYREMFAPQGD